MKTVIYFLCWLGCCMPLQQLYAQTKPVTSGQKTDSSKPATHELHEVVVRSSSKPLIEQGIDKTIVNVDAQISNAGANMLEVLQKAPGIVIDEDGNITFKGKTGVLVLIDDKPTYLSAADLAAYLKSLPSSAVDKIELMDNPPAKYDAAGAGVINIKTKKITTRGFNSNMTGSYIQGMYWRYSGSVNMNYHSGKWNLFANLGSYNEKKQRILDVTRDYYDSSGNPLSWFTQSNLFLSRFHNGNIKLGLDYNSSSRTTWGVVVSGTLSDNQEYRPNYNNLYNAAHQLDSSVIAENTQHTVFHRGSANLNYLHKFDTTGRQVSVDLDYSHFDIYGDPVFLYNTYNPQGVLLDTQRITGHIPGTTNIYAAKTDWVFPFSTGSQLQLGAKTSYVATNNAADYYNIVNGHGYVDNTTTNRFLYNENINAAYLSYSRKLRRFSLQLGLRLENTNGFGHQLGNAVVADSAFAKHYTSLFPTAYFSYKLDTAGTHVLNLSFGRRISRPYYQDLNPFVFFQNKYTYFSGNPYLRPQFTSTSKLSYQYKSLLTVGVMYDYATDIQIETIRQDSSVLISTTGNIGHLSHWNFNTSLAIKPARWWTVNLYGELNYSHYTSALYNSYLNTSSLYAYCNGSNQFSFDKGWSAELSFMYQSPATFAQFKKVPFSQLNMGIQKKLWKDKGSVKLSARDIFNSYASAGFITSIPNAVVHFHNAFDSRSVSLSLTYNFGKHFETREKRNDNNEEVNRVKN